MQTTRVLGGTTPQAVLVKGASGVVVYGEVSASVKVGVLLNQGDTIGTVAAVLKKSKGRPMVMLHFELLSPDEVETLWWRVPQDCPFGLLDPTPT